MARGSSHGGRPGCAVGARHPPLGRVRRVQVQVLLRFEYLRTVLLAQAEDPPRLHAPAAPVGPASGVPGASGVADQATLDAVFVEALGMLDRLTALQVDHMSNIQPFVVHTLVEAYHSDLAPSLREVLATFELSAPRMGVFSPGSSPLRQHSPRRSPRRAQGAPGPAVAVAVTSAASFVAAAAGSGAALNSHQTLTRRSSSVRSIESDKSAGGSAAAASAGAMDRRLRGAQRWPWTTAGTGQD